MSADRATNLVVSGLTATILVAGAGVPEPSRSLQTLVFLALLAALWSVGWRLAGWLLPDDGRLSRAVAAFTFAVGMAVVPATWMGHFGALRPAVFLVWTAVALLASRWIPRRSTGADTVSAAVRDGETAVRTDRSARVETALLLAAALSIALAGVRAVHGQLYQPTELFDDLSYHLSAVATWIRHGDLRMIRFSMGDPSTPFYPILGEMSSWVLLAPFRDSDVAARWTQLPFALFSLLATAAIARRLGLSRRDAALAAIAYGGIRRVFPFLALGAGNDHSTCFFTLAALDGALALARRPRPGAAVVTGAALGLLLATKYIGVLFAPVIVAALVLAALSGRRREGSARWSPRLPGGLALLLAMTVAVSGGYTYLRNAVTTGNPIFPAPVRILGIDVFPGWQGVTAADRRTASESRINVWRFLARNSNLFGWYFSWTLLPAALVAPWLAGIHRRRREALVFSLPAVFFLQFLFLMHDHRDIRYFLPAIALAAVALAWCLAQLGPWAFRLRAVFLLWIVAQALWPFGWSPAIKGLAGLVLFAAGALLVSAWRRDWRPGTAKWAPSAVAALLAVLAVPLGQTVETYQARKLARKHGPLALERLAGPHGARVAFTGFNNPYLYFGSRLQNDVNIVPRNSALDAQYYRWGSRLAEPYAVRHYRRWRNNVERLGIELVVVIRSPFEDPERSWMVRRTADFRRVYEDGETEIWRVLGAQEAATPSAGAGHQGRRK